MHASTRNLLGALALTFALVAVNTSARADALDPNDPAKSVSMQHSPESMRVVTGTVVSSSANTLILDLVGDEMMTFVVDAASSMPAGLDAGSTVRVEYHEIVGVAGNTLHAANVTTMSGSTTSTNPMTTPPQTNYDMPPTTTTPATTRATDLDRPATTSNDATPYRATNDREMPRTSSPLPLVGLAGLAAVAIGFGLRRINSL